MGPNAQDFAIRRPFPHHGWTDISVLLVHLESTDAHWTTAALEARPVLKIDRPSLQPAQGIRDLTYDIERQQSW
jgi:hypothetical protein